MEEARNEIDLELQAAQEALRRAQQRKADAEEAARLAAQAALAKNLADEQERLARLQREARGQRLWAEKRAAEETQDALKRLLKTLKPADLRLNLRRGKKLLGKRPRAKDRSARCKRLHGRWKLMPQTLKHL